MNRGLILFREVNVCFWTPEASTFSSAKSQDSSIETAGNDALKVSMLRGSDLSRSLLRKVLDFGFLTVAKVNPSA